MSYFMKGTDIYLTRGDSLLLQLDLTRNGEEYIPEEGCVVRFAMKRKYSDSDEKVILLKNIPIDTMILEITPEDTKGLSMNKSFVYDIELTDADGYVDTFLKGHLIIKEEVI